jgi:hypothetical protein
MYAKTVRDRRRRASFVKLKSVHQLPPAYEEWLTAAAMLQEVGSFVNRGGGRHPPTLLPTSDREPSGIFG